MSYAKGVKEFKIWDPIKNKMVIIKYVIFDEQLMSKKSVTTDVSTSKGETSNKQVI